MNMLKVCIIGQSGHGIHVLGDWQKQKTPVWIAAVSDGGEGRGCDELLDACRAIDPAVAKYRDYRAMLDAEQPDVAVINGYCGANTAVSIECMRRGIHVFAEKPAAVNLAELKLLEESWEKSGSVYSSMMAIRFTPWFQTAKLLLSDGILGDVRLIQAQKSYRMGFRGEMYRNGHWYGGSIPWVGSHAIDWIYWLTGRKFLAVSAFQSRCANRGNQDLETTAQCQFLLEKESLAQVSLDYLRPEQAETHDDDRIRLAGTKGILEIKEKNVWLIDRQGTHQVPLLSSNTTAFAEFIKKVCGQKNQAVSQEDAFYITRVCLKARESAEKSGELIPISVETDI